MLGRAEALVYRWSRRITACGIYHGLVRSLAYVGFVTGRSARSYPSAEGRLPDLLGTCLGSYGRFFERR